MPMRIVQWKPFRYVVRIIQTAICLILVPSLGFADAPKNDAEKKEAVYYMYANYKKSFKKVTEISVKDAMALAERGELVFVDVRKPAEYKTSRLPGAVSQLDFLFETSRYTDKTIVGYCTISFRSGQLAKDLVRKGITMLNLQGGILAWVHEGGKIYDDKGETHRLHVNGKRWDLAPEGYETVVFRFRDRFF